ncbi:MAG: translocation/assembly module TamB domain-containing protein [Candidatus Muiribacteriota bacterium]
MDEFKKMNFTSSFIRKPLEAFLKGELITPNLVNDIEFSYPDNKIKGVSRHKNFTFKYNLKKSDNIIFGDIFLSFDSNIDFAGSFRFDLKQQYILIYNAELQTPYFSTPVEIIYSDATLELMAGKHLKAFYNLKTDNIDFNLEILEFNEYFSGTMNYNSGDFKLSSEKESIIEGNIWQFFFSMNYRLSTYSLNSVNLSNIDFFIEYDEKLSIKGKVEEVELYNQTFENLLFDYFHLENKFVFKTVDEKINIEADTEGNFTGNINNLSIKKEFYNKNFRLNISEIQIKGNFNKIKIRPQKLSIDFQEHKYNYDTGEIFFEDNQVYLKGVRFSYKADYITVNGEFGLNSQNFEINHSGKEPVLIYGNNKIKNRNLKITSRDKIINSEAEFSDMLIQVQDIPVKLSGKINYSSIEEENTGEIILEYDSVKYFFLLNFNKDFSYFKLKSQEQERLKLDNEFILTQIEGDLLLEAFKEDNIYLIECTLNLTDSFIELFEVPDIKPELENNVEIKSIELNLKNLNFNTDLASYLISGRVVYNMDEYKNRIGLIVKKGNMIIADQNFRITGGRIDYVYFKNNFLNVNNKYIYRLDETENTTFMDNIWINFNLHKTFGRYDIFGNLTGYIKDPDIDFYSNPPLSTEELYQKITDNKIAELVFGKQADVTDVVDVFGIDKALSNRLAQDFNIDKLDIQAHEDDLKIELEKEVARDIAVTVTHSTSERESTYGIIYKINRYLLLEGEDVTNIYSENYRMKLRWLREF